MSKKTIKVSRRVNSKGSYNYGYHPLKTGYRFDIPYYSVSVFTGGHNKTVRHVDSGIRFIYENNRKGKTRIAHNVR